MLADVSRILGQCEKVNKLLQQFWRKSWVLSLFLHTLPPRAIFLLYRDDLRWPVQLPGSQRDQTNRPPPPNQRKAQITPNGVLCVCRCVCVGVCVCVCVRVRVSLKSQLCRWPKSFWLFTTWQHREPGIGRLCVFEYSCVFVCVWYIYSQVSQCSSHRL